MSYTRGIPAENQPVSLWQKQERRNSFVRDDVFGEDHYPFSDPQNGGNHRKTTIPDQSGDPDTLADEYGLYSKEDGGVNSIYVREPSNGLVNNIIDDNTFGSVQKIGGLVLGASCKFDRFGIIFNSFNVASGEADSVPGTPPIIRVKLNFSNTLPTNDYFWTCDYFNRTVSQAPSPLIGIYAGGSSVYDQSVNVDFIRFQFFPLGGGLIGNRFVFNFKVWLLA